MFKLEWRTWGDFSPEDDQVVFVRGGIVDYDEPLPESNNLGMDSFAIAIYSKLDAMFINLNSVEEYSPEQWSPVPDAIARAAKEFLPLMLRRSPSGWIPELVDRWLKLTSSLSLLFLPVPTDGILPQSACDTILAKIAQVRTALETSQ